MRESLPWFRSRAACNTANEQVEPGNLVFLVSATPGIEPNLCVTLRVDLQDCGRHSRSRRRFLDISPKILGRVAQLAEQLTLNQ